MSHSSFSENDKEHLVKIHVFHNGWRQRTIEIYEHPSLDGMVVTYGYPDNGDDPIICEEKYTDYQREIENKILRTY